MDKNAKIAAGIVAGIAVAGIGYYAYEQTKKAQASPSTYSATWYLYGLASGDQATITVNGTEYTVSAGSSLTLNNLSGDVPWTASNSAEGATPYPSSGTVTPSNTNVYIRYTYTTQPPPPPPQEPLSVSITITPVSQVSEVSASDPTYGPAPVTLQFTANVTGGVSPYSYSWNFGNGQTSTSNPASTTYNESGNYTVTVTVTDAIGETASASTTVTITEAPTLTVKVTTYEYNGTYYAVEGQSIDVTASLEEAGLGVANETIEFLVNGTQVATATTDSSGRAEVQITAPSSTGQLAISAYFAGDSSLGLASATSNTVNVTVVPPLSVSISTSG